VHEDAEDEDVRVCIRCGDPLPVDGACDCEGTERDRSAPENILRYNKVVTAGGVCKTFRLSLPASRGAR
jgi:hypothetical protein